MRVKWEWELGDWQGEATVYDSADPEVPSIGTNGLPYRDDGDFDDALHSILAAKVLALANEKGNAEVRLAEFSAQIERLRAWLHRLQDDSLPFTTITLRQWAYRALAGEHAPESNP